MYAYRHLIKNFLLIIVTLVSCNKEDKDYPEHQPPMEWSFKGIGAGIEIQRNETGLFEIKISKESEMEIVCLNYPGFSFDYTNYPGYDPTSTQPTDIKRLIKEWIVFEIIGNTMYCNFTEMQSNYNDTIVVDVHSVDTFGSLIFIRENNRKYF